MCYIDGQNNKYSVLNECNRMLKYNISSCNRQLGSVLHVLNCQNSRDKLQSIPSSCFISFSDILSIPLFATLCKHFFYSTRPPNTNQQIEFSLAKWILISNYLRHCSIGRIIRVYGVYCTVIPSYMDREMHEKFLDLSLYSHILNVYGESIYFNYTKSFTMLTWFHWGQKVKGDEMFVLNTSWRNENWFQFNIILLHFSNSVQVILFEHTIICKIIFLIKESVKR
jgi:hypothetical protein